MNQEQIAALKAAAVEVNEWSNCNTAWLDTADDSDCAVVGHIDEDGNDYPVSVVDCAQYYSGDSLKLAKFYAKANPATILALLAERDALIARAEAAERDAELLGFIEANPEYYLRQSKRHWWFSKGQYPTEGYKTMREAISAAMENEKC